MSVEGKITIDVANSTFIIPPYKTSHIDFIIVGVDNYPELCVIPTNHLLMQPPKIFTIAIDKSILDTYFQEMKIRHISLEYIVTRLSFDSQNKLLITAARFIDMNEHSCIQLGVDHVNANSKN